MQTAQLEREIQVKQIVICFFYQKEFSLCHHLQQQRIQIEEFNQQFREMENSFQLVIHPY